MFSRNSIARCLSSSCCLRMRTPQRGFHHLREETLKKVSDDVETQVGPVEKWASLLGSLDPQKKTSLFALTSAHWKAAGHLTSTRDEIFDAQIALAKEKLMPKLAKEDFSPYSTVLRALLARDGPTFVSDKQEPKFSWVKRGDIVEETLELVGKVMSIGFLEALKHTQGKYAPLVLYGAMGNGKTCANDQVADVLISAIESLRNSEESAKKAKESFYPPANVLFINPYFHSLSPNVPEIDESFYFPGALSMLTRLPIEELSKFNAQMSSNLLRLWCLARGGDASKKILLVIRADEFHRRSLASRTLIRFARDVTMRSGSNIDVLLSLSGFSSDIQLSAQEDLRTSYVMPRYVLVPVVADPSFGLAILDQAVQKYDGKKLSDIAPLVQYALKRATFTLGGHPRSLSYLDVLANNKPSDVANDLGAAMEWSQKIYLQIKKLVIAQYDHDELLGSLEFDGMLRVIAYAHSRTPLGGKMLLNGHNLRHHLDSGLLAATEDSNGEFTLSLSWLMLHIFCEALGVNKDSNDSLPLFPTCIFDKPITKFPDESSYLDELFISFYARNGKLERTAMAALQLSFFSKVLQACDVGENVAESVSVAALRGLPGSDAMTSIQTFPVRRPPAYQSSTSTGSSNQHTSTFLNDLYSNVKKNACFSRPVEYEEENPLFDFFPQFANQPEDRKSQPLERVKQAVLEAPSKTPVHFPLRADHALIDAVTLFPPNKKSSVLLLSSITGSEHFDMDNEFKFVKDILLEKLGKLFMAMHLFRTGLGLSGSNASHGPKIEVVGELVTDRIVLGLLEPSEAHHDFLQKFYKSKESMKPLTEVIERERQQRTDLHDLLFEKKTVQEWEKRCVDQVPDAAKDDDPFQSLLPATSEKVSFAQFLTRHPRLLFVDASYYEKAFGLFSGPGLARIYHVCDQWAPLQSK